MSYANTRICVGVVKVNLDTDLQYAYLTGIRDYVLKNKDYLLTQVGNPDGPVGAISICHGQR